MSPNRIEGMLVHEEETFGVNQCHAKAEATADDGSLLQGNAVRLMDRYCW
jgi:hypothetical protein